MKNELLQKKGRIFDIQRYSIHDGPGIRTIVFLKGCYLRCQWCSNPESQEYEIQTMMVAGKPKIIGRDVTVEEVLAEVRKDMPYYRKSGGGLTLSGGESLYQADFAAALLCEAQEMGINTAIESTACTEFSQVEKILPFLDTFLLDIKHMDSEKHKKHTGVSNERILENAEKIARVHQNLIIRVPVIPGFNHTVAEIEQIAKFAASLPGVKEIHLLPYHRLGQDKYTGLGRQYLLDGVEPMRLEEMETLQAIALKTGLTCQIGG